MKMLSFDCPPELARRFWVMCRARNVTSGEMLRTIMTHEIEKWEMTTGRLSMQAQEKKAAKSP